MFLDIRRGNSLALCAQAAHNTSLAFAETIKRHVDSRRFDGVG
jgi:hypothetical protein